MDQGCQINEKNVRQEFGSVRGKRHCMCYVVKYNLNRRRKVGIKLRRDRLHGLSKKTRKNVKKGKMGLAI